MPQSAEAPRKLKNKRERNPHLHNVRKMIEDTKFHRHIAHSLEGYERHLKAGGVKLYSDAEIEEIKKAGVTDRLPPRATAYYMELANRSEAIANLIKARKEEMEDLSGEKDPSNQLKYSPVDGLLHKYELVLLYVVRVCSSWCRYCYRSDFLTGKTEKDIGSLSDITGYIREHNEKVKKNQTIQDVDRHFVESEQEQYPIREALLSGGDPMVLSNRNLFEYLEGLADCGIRTIRIGTKELAFFPYRFDDNFFAMLEIFHERHPNVNIAFMTHFTHPDELLMKDDKGNYVLENDYHYSRIPPVEEAIQKLRSRNYVTLENQTPIIDSVNDDPMVLRRLQIELKRIGVNNHYFFQCREIEGHRIFAVPVEKAFDIHRNSQKGLSGIERSRFALSTEDGKMEVVGVINGIDVDDKNLSIPDTFKPVLNELLGDGVIVFRAHRSPNAQFQGDLIIAKRNPEALWISGYEDRIIYDGRNEANQKYAPMVEMLVGQLAGN